MLTNYSIYSLLMYRAGWVAGTDSVSVGEATGMVLFVHVLSFAREEFSK